MISLQKKYRIGIIGANAPSKFNYKIAEELGELLAKEGFIIVCGGLGGIMEAASAGARKADGLVIGILPGNNFNQANPYVNIPIASGIGYLRNGLVVMNSDLVVAIDGKYGTLSELAFCQIYKKPAITINSLDLPFARKADSAAEALALIREILNQE